MNVLSQFCRALDDCRIELEKAASGINRAVTDSLDMASSALADGTIGETIRSLARLANAVADCSDECGGTFGSTVRSMAHLANAVADCLDELTGRAPLPPP